MNEIYLFNPKLQVPARRDLEDHRVDVIFCFSYFKLKSNSIYVRRLIKRWNLNTIFEGCPKRDVKRKKTEVVIYYSHIHTILCLLTIIILPFCDRIAESIGQTMVVAKKIESLNRVACALHNNSTNSYRWLFCGRSLNFTGNPRTDTTFRPKKWASCVWGLDDSRNHNVMHQSRHLFGWARMSVWSVWNYRKHSFVTKK